MANAHQEKRATALLCLATALFCFGSVPVFLKYFTDYLDAWTVNGVRYSIGALFWLPFVLYRYRRDPPAGRVWVDALRPAAINIIAQTGFAIAPYHNDASVLGFVLRSSFLFTIVFGFWLLREERFLARRPNFWLGVLCVGGGIAAMHGWGIQTTSTSTLGISIVIATAMGWGLYTVFIRKYMKDYSVRLSFGVISLYTATGLLLLMFVFGDWRKLAGMSAVNGGLLAVSALVGVAFGHVLLYRVIQTLGPIVTQGGASLVPLVTVTGAHLFLGERLIPLQWSGGLLLLIGCYCLLLAKAPTRREAIPPD